MLLTAHPPQSKPIHLQMNVFSTVFICILKETPSMGFILPAVTSQWWLLTTCECVCLSVYLFWLLCSYRYRKGLCMWCCRCHGRAWVSVGVVLHSRLISGWIHSNQSDPLPSPVFSKPLKPWAGYSPGFTAMLDSKINIQKKNAHHIIDCIEIDLKNVL